MTKVEGKAGESKEGTKLRGWGEKVVNMERTKTEESEEGTL